MTIYCCICGSRISESDECFELNQNYNNECVCSDCADHLEELKSYAKSGNSLYKASRRDLSQLLNRGKASENGMSYCEHLLEKANVIFDRAQTTRNDHPPKPARAEEPKPANPQISPVSKSKSAPISAAIVGEPAAGRQPPVTSTIAQPEPEAVSKPEKLVCKSCGTENLSDSMFCEHCAAQLRPQKFCRFCGGKVSPVTGYCEVCSRDSSGKVYRRTSDGERIIQAAGRIGESIISGTSSARQKIPTFNWPILTTVLITIVLVFMAFGKVLSIPAISSLWGDDVPSSYSLLDVSNISDSMYDTISSINNSVDLDVLRVISIIILIAVVGALVFFGLSVVMQFKSKRRAFRYLKYASTIMCIILSLVVIGIIGLNQYIDDESSGWITAVFKGTPLLYISLICNALVAIFGVKSLRYHYTIDLETTGNEQDVIDLYLDMQQYKDCSQRLDDLGYVNESDSY